MLVSDRDGTCRIFNPAHDYKLVVTHSNYHTVQKWLLEDEYEQSSKSTVSRRSSITSEKKGVNLLHEPNLMSTVSGSLPSRTCVKQDYSSSSVFIKRSISFLSD